MPDASRGRSFPDAPHETRRNESPVKAFWSVGVMKRIAFAILLAFAAPSATSVVWADSSTTSTVTTEAP